MSRVEVGWDNLIVGLRGHASLSGEFLVQPGDFDSRSARTHRARPGLISVAGEGVYLRLHNRFTPDEPTYFFRDAATKRAVEKVPGQSSLSKLVLMPGRPSMSSTHEMVLVEGQHEPLLLLGGGEVVVRNQGSAAAAYLLGLLDPAQRGAGQSVRIGYQGESLGFVSILAALDDEFHEAHFVRLLPDGGYASPQPVALQVDLPEAWAPCDASQRQKSPRVVAPAFPARVHAVHIADGGGRLVALDTHQAVLFGSREKPCVAAFEARPRASLSRAKVQYRALLFPGQTASWLFKSEGRANGERRVAARPLECAF